MNDPRDQRRMIDALKENAELTDQLKQRDETIKQKDEEIKELREALKELIPIADDLYSYAVGAGYTDFEYGKPRVEISDEIDKARKLVTE